MAYLSLFRQNVFGGLFGIARFVLAESLVSTLVPAAIVLMLSVVGPL